MNNQTVEFIFLENFSVHSVFHVNLLKPYVFGPLNLGDIQQPESSIEIDEKTEYEVTTIIDSRYFVMIKKLQY